MRLSTKGLALSLGLLWGGAMLVVGLFHMAVPTYGGVFLSVISSVYPGADTTSALGPVLIGALYGFVDGAIAGALVALLYNALSPRLPAKAN